MYKRQGCIVSQRYDNAVNTKIYNDFRDVNKWINNQGSAPEWLQKISVHDFDLKNPKLHRSFMGLIVRKGSKDFLTGQLVKISDCQDDHIFPKSVLSKKQINVANSILNRTLISKNTNQHKSNKFPQTFLADCLKKHGNNRTQLLETLASHFIYEDGFVAMQKNDFPAFVECRRKAIQDELLNIFSVAKCV